MKAFTVSNKNGISFIPAALWQVALFGFLVANPSGRKATLMMVHGQHEAAQCNPVDTKMILESLVVDPNDADGPYVASAEMKLIAACSCTNGLTFYRLEIGGKRGKKLNFGNPSDVLFGSIGIQKNGWMVKNGGTLFNFNGILQWRWSAEKGNTKIEIATRFNFKCEKKENECEATYTYSGLLKYIVNGVTTRRIPFSSSPETQEDELLPLLANEEESVVVASADDTNTEPPLEADSGESLVRLMETPTTEAGSCGDPHFTTWSGKRFDFHGECDLVLASSPSFGNGLGLDVHIRTTMVSRAKHPYSYISEAAVRIGKEILSVSRDGYWLNGVTHSFENDGTFAMSGYAIDISDSATKKGKFMKKFVVDLTDGHSVTVKAASSHIDVSLNKMGRRGHFDDVVGLLGRHHDQAMVDRNGNSMIELQANQIGQMWQVREWEDMMFPVAVGPQHPTKCKLPPATQTARHLRSNVDMKTLQKAQGACSHVQHTSDRDNCIFDVLATGDIEMADFYDD